MKNTRFKLLLCALGCGLLCVGFAVAREVILAWSPNTDADQVTEYRVYEMTGAGWAQIGQTTDVRFSVGDREPGFYEFAVTAVNFWGESARSESVTTPAGVPMPPAGPVIQGAKNVALEVSDDLETWKQVAVVSSFSDRDFFRVAFVEGQ